MKTTELNTSADPDEPVHKTAARRPCSGILVLTSSLQLLHRNSQALELSRRINQAQGGRESSDLLPTVVMDLCDEIRKVLQIRIATEDWAQFTVRRLIGDPPTPLVLHGMGLPHRAGLQRSRILIMMKELNR